MKISKKNIGKETKLQKGDKHTMKIYINFLLIFKD